MTRRPGPLFARVGLRVDRVAPLAARLTLASLLGLTPVPRGAGSKAGTLPQPGVTPTRANPTLRLPSPEFERLERLELERGLIPRSVTSRYLPPSRTSPVTPSAVDGTGPIEASVYSLPSSAFSSDEVLPFLSDVLALDSERTVIVMSDGALARRLEAQLDPRSRERLRVLDTHRPGYSPWPRDAMTFRRDRAGRVELWLRPNRQSGRSEDSELALELIQSLPPDVDRAWGEPRWSVSPVPFHNGQLLVDDRFLWLGLHTLEPRILELLGEERVPVEDFDSSAGVDRYLEAASRAAFELERTFARPTRFVHPLPGLGDDAGRRVAMQRIGAGAGLDLDSYLTILPAAPGSDTAPTALVGSLEEGASLLHRSGAKELIRLAEIYRISPLPRDRADLRTLLLERLESDRSRARQSYLDSVADHLAGEGLRVRRTPLLMLPGALVKVGSAAEPPADALIGWNNVVVELGTVRRAEGFASGVDGWDESARSFFGEAGYRLDLVTPLVHSVLYNGGYRCASNHLRAAVEPR